MLNSEVSMTETERRDALRALGLNPDLIVFPRPTADEDVQTSPTSSNRRLLQIARLSDEEWAAILNSEILPAEPPQHGAMGHREFVEAILTVVGRGARWTDLDPIGLSSEAVRKKFSRYQKKGIWVALSRRAQEIDLPAGLRAALRTAAARR